MKANEFDRNARNRLSKHESELNVDSFWDQLEPKLPKDKLRPKGFLLFLLLGLLVCSALIGWHWLGKSKQQNFKSMLPEQANQTQNQLATRKEGIDNASITSNTTGQSEVNHSVESKEKSVSYSTNQNSKTQIRTTDLQMKNGSNNNSINEEQVKTHSKNKFVKPYTKNGSLNTHSGDQPLNYNKDKIDLNPLVMHSNPKTSSTNDGLKNQTERSYVLTGRASELSSNELGSSDDNLIEEQKREVIKSNSLPGFLFPVFIKKQLHNIDFVLIPTVSNPTKVIIPVKESLKLQLIPIIGIGYYNKQLSGSGNDTISNYILQRNNAESKLEEWLFGLNVKVSYKHLGLLTGLEYSSRNERFSYTSTKEENHFGNTEIRLINNDSIIYSSGIGWYGTSQLRKVINYNTVHQWNVPLGLNYEFVLNTFRIDFRAGAVFSINNKISGKTLDAGLNIADWNQSSDLSNRTNLGVGWFGDLSCSIPLTHFIGLNAGFRIQEFPGNYLDGPLSLHYRSYYFRSGLVLKLK